jgi:hypothetical protein
MQESAFVEDHRRVAAVPGSAVDGSIPSVMTGAAFSPLHAAKVTTETSATENAKRRASDRVISQPL